MKKFKHAIAATLLSISTAGISLPVFAADYIIDTSGAHASINFKIKHLGYSWLYGRFDNFSGNFKFDPKKPEASKINVMIETGSVNTNHAERDKHLRSNDFLSASKYPKASFVSTRIEESDDNSAKIYGTLTLRGVKKDIVIDGHKVGEGKDPWGGYRAGFSGTTSLALKDFGMQDLGPASTHVEMQLEIEGIRQ